MAAWTSNNPYKPVLQLGLQGERRQSPVPPVCEPLSPTRDAQETPYTQCLQRIRQKFGQPRPLDTYLWSVRRDREILGNSAHIAEYVRRRRSSNTIKDLAEAAAVAERAGGSYTRPPSYPYDPCNAPYSAPALSSRPSSQWSMSTSQFASHPNNKLEDAALLLNFAGHSPVTSTRQPIIPTGGYHWHTSVPDVRSSVDVQMLDTSSTHLPSPGVSSEDKYKQALAEYEDSTPMEDIRHGDGLVDQQLNIRTPPDEDTQGTPSRDEDDDGTDGKPRARRGWPKGKPRGPKKSINGIGSTKTKSTTSRRSRKSAAAKSTDDIETMTQPRRKSFTDSSLRSKIPAATLPKRPSSVPPGCRCLPGKPRSAAGRKPMPKFTKETICEHCNVARESQIGEMDDWVSCNGCKKWFHSDCAGFGSQRELRDVDKFFCKPCEPEHGATTFVRKSNRAHAAVDYAGLNQGVLKTSDDCHEHHYIQPIKDGTLFNFDPETFPRMPPELVTAEYFERSACFNQPILIPAALNPKPAKRQQRRREAAGTVSAADVSVEIHDEEMLDEFEYDTAHDDGQDRLDMVIPQDLTIRDVCNLVGPDYPLDVIDVKVQGTESGRWNLGKWADYYEMEGEKAIRNVISLEVSETKLGRLLRRPEIVRQIDLQDNVWPKDEYFKSVAFYCLMSVEDSYTDFHVDFGGSSVYYHILRGSKTFFFIPPKPKHLKAYEDWNDSHEQNYTFLPNMTKECYRVDLFEGDTMLIPSGWIHAVWTPSNSLVIGGNFLTNMHYGMQFRIVEVEKANKTPTKFRYPKFQKVMWYSVIKYLKEDPLPEEVRSTFYSGHKFERTIPTWQDFDHCGEPADQGKEDYHARYYSQMELDGLPELASFIFRTVMIATDRIEGVTVETRRNVTASIPKGYGEPLELAKTFALWVAWKRGNEDPPAFAQPDFGLPDKEGVEPKKLSSKMLKQKQRQEAFEAYKMAPERQSARQKQQESVKAATAQPQLLQSPSADNSPRANLGPRRVACDACRRRRIRCKHKDDVASEYSLVGPSTPAHVRRPSREFQAVVINRPLASIKGTPMAKTIPYTPGSAAFSTPASAQPFTPGTADADPNAKRPRSKACPECRKSKRRCIHDEFGNVDAFKESQTPIPRANVGKKRKTSGEGVPEQKRMKVEPAPDTVVVAAGVVERTMVDSPIDPLLISGQVPGQTSFAEFAAQALGYSAAADEVDRAEVQALEVVAEASRDEDEEMVDAPGFEEVAEETPEADDLLKAEVVVETVPEAAVDEDAEEDDAVAEQQLDPAALDDRHDSASEVTKARSIDLEDTPKDEGAAAMSEEQPATIEQVIQSKEVEVAKNSPTGADEDDTAREHIPQADALAALSAASSPLSNPMSSPEPAAPAPVATSASPATVRASARAAKPIERFSTSHFVGSLLTKPTKAAVPPPPSRKRKATPPTPASADFVAPSPKRAKTPARPRDKVSRTPQPRFSSEASEEDERYARELAGQSFGLRRRKSVNGI